MKQAFCLVLSLLLNAVAPGVATAGEGSSTRRGYDRATIYFVGWDVLTRSRLSIEDVKRSAPIVVQIRRRAEASKFAQSLHLDEMTAVTPPTEEDKRLVIELLRVGGGVEVYYANARALLSSDSTRSRVVDAEFRKRFEIVQ